MNTIIKIAVIFLIIFSIGTTANSQIVPTNGTVYVKADGTGNGSSWANATGDLQGAIDANGVARVWIAEGTYYPTWQWDTEDPRAFSFKMKNGVAILGGFPNTGDPILSDRNPLVYVVILSGDLGIATDYSDNAYHVIYNIASLELNEYSYISGVNINFGNANGLDGDKNRGGGVHNEGCSPKFYNCKISYNHGIRGAGMYNRESSPYLGSSDFKYNESEDIGGGILNSTNSSPLMVYCYMISNTAIAYGAGISNVDNSNPFLLHCVITANNCDGSAGGILNSENSNPHIESCKVYNNKVAEYGGGILNSQSNPLIVNCIISNNEASLAGGGILNADNSNPSIINSTIAQNWADISGSSIANENSSPNITNCILWDNHSDIFNQGTSNPQITYSCVQNGYAGTGNISDDPLFKITSFTDFYLQFSSPAINAGLNDSVPTGVIEDAHNNERILKGIVDMGAYELTGIIYVKQSAPGSEDGISWYNAYTSLESALAVAEDGCEIWVAAGTYMPSDENGTGTGADYYTFKLKPGVSILGGFAGTEESSDQRNWLVNKVYLEGNLGSDRVFHVVTASNDCDEETLLDGVTIRNGQASGYLSFRNGANIYVNGSSPRFKNLSVYNGTCGNNGANIYVENSNAKFEDCYIDSGESDNYGGGIAVNNASPFFTGCNISDNYAYGMGGGVSITGDGVPFFLDCIFAENHANSSGNGGAFYVAAQVDTLLIVNSYFAENYASVSGGAMDISGKTIIVNSTFGTNYAQDASAKGGHLYLRSGADVEIYNSVLTAGSADIGEQIYAVSGSQLSVSNSMIEDCGGSGSGWDAGLGTDNGGNLDFDAYWYDFDAAVTSDWPGIDAGTSGIYENIEILNSVTLDINGYPRFRGTEVDMGHKEIPYCWLQMTILPPEISGEAQWTYNGGTDWHAHADGFWEVPQDITVEFSEVTGYTTPESIYVSMDWSGDYMIFGEYVIISSVNPNSTPSVSAYPNPTAGIINIENQNGCSYDEIILLSADGRIISRQEVNTANSFDLRDLPAGLYIIKAGNETIKINKN